MLLLMFLLIDVFAATAGLLLVNVVDVLCGWL